MKHQVSFHDQTFPWQLLYVKSFITSCKRFQCYNREWHSDCVLFCTDHVGILNHLTLKVQVKSMIAGNGKMITFVKS